MTRQSRRIPNFWVKIVLALFVFTLVVFCLHGAYLAIVLLIFEHGSQDPIYLLTGLTRTAQFKMMVGAFLFVAYCGIAVYAINNFKRPKFSENRTGITLLFLLLSLNFLAASLSAIFAEMHSQYWIPLLAFVAFVIALQVAIVYASLSRIKNAYALLGLMVLLSTFNAYAIHVVLLTTFLLQPVHLKIAIMAMLALSFGFLYATAGQQPAWTKRINALLLLAMLSPVSLMYFQQEERQSEAAMMTPFEGIELARKPDIHIVSFDSLIPPILADRFLGLPSVPYESLLNGDDVIVFKNAFASWVPTKSSLNSVMRLAHPDFYNARLYDYFTGQENSPVAEIFASNGYRISTGAASMSLGMGGDYVTDYHPPPGSSIGHSALCFHATKKSELLFFGFCAAASLVEGPVQRGEWPKKLVEIIRRTGDGSTPDLTFHYVGMPSHTGPNFRSFDEGFLAEYRAMYAHNSERLVAYLDELIQVINDKKDDSIFFIFGDHGTYVSRSVTLEENPKFYVQDRHGILAAVLVNDSRCSAQDFNHYNKDGFSSPEQILAGLIRCLSVDATRMDAAVNFEGRYNMKDFLYE